LIDPENRPLIADWTRSGLAAALCLCVFWVATVGYVLWFWVFLTSFAAIVALALGLLPKTRATRSRLDIAWFIIVILFIILIHLAIGMQDKAGWNYARRTTLWLFAAPLFFVAYRVHLPLRWLSGITSLAAVTIFLLTAYSKFGLGNFRAQTVGGPVQSGVVCSIVAVVALVLHGVFEGWRRAVCFTAALLAMAATLFTGTRGATLILPVACVACAAFYWRTSPRRENLVRVACFLAFWFLFLAVPDLGLTQRWGQVRPNITAMHEDGAAGSPVGLRLAWYRAGLEELKTFSLFGEGQSHWMNLQSEHVESGRFHPVALQHRHLHNQWLDVGVKAGWIGLALVSLILFLPLWRFGRATLDCRHGWDYQIYGFCGLMIALAINSASLADCALRLPNAAVFFVTMTIVLSGQLTRVETMPHH
jgi:O-antigen ligase